MAKVRSFSTPESYRKWNAYRWIHLKNGGHKKGTAYPKVEIGGKIHQVVHKQAMVSDWFMYKPLKKPRSFPR